MSTKIYNGYKINNINSLLELKEFCQRITPIFEEAQKQLLGKITADIAVKIIDKLKFNLSVDYYITKEHKNKKFTNSVYREAKYLVEEKQRKIKQTGQRDPSYDIEINIIFIPIQNKMLSIFYAERQELTNIWKNFDEVEYYGYWDNTDRDEKCTEDEWDQRDKDWEEALPGVGIPSENGFVWSALENIPLYGINEVLNNLPSDENRIANIAEDLLWLDYIKNKQTDNISSIHSYFDFRHELKNSLAEKLENKKEYVKNNLHTINKQVLLKEIEFDLEKINSIDEL